MKTLAAIVVVAVLVGSGMVLDRKAPWIQDAGWTAWSWVSTGVNTLLRR